MTLFASSGGAAGRLRRRLDSSSILVAPGCFDALSARIVERAGFEAAFLGGFATAATRLALPDAGLLSYGEMVDQGRDVCSAVSIPVLGDADTGYGNAINAQRTVLGFARAGFACVMIEDQVWPKRCGHTRGKDTVDRGEALARVRAAVEARDAAQTDILILARTDAIATEGLDEALIRAAGFVEAGADMTFVEAPRSAEEMSRYCDTVPGLKMANMVEQGASPWLSPADLEAIGYSFVAYPLSLLMASVSGMEAAAGALLNGGTASSGVSFEALQEVVGFPDYDRLRDRFDQAGRAAGEEADDDELG